MSEGKVNGRMHGSALLAEAVHAVLGVSTRVVLRGPGHKGGGGRLARSGQAHVSRAHRTECNAIAHSVAVSYTPPMLVTRVQLPACACGTPLAGTHMRVRVYGSSAPSSAGRWRWWQCCCCLNSWAGNAPHISISTLPGPPACPHHHRVVQLAHDRTCSQDLPGRCRHS